jgi:DNA repair exonuclease SbcCD ATPase subunit/DNA repair exonuclease SbcCD nuclease subunit
MKIAHFADIHIRNASRHEEYRKVFAEAHRSVKSKKIELAVISGDLFHSKTVLSPESVSLASEFILGFSCPVIIITGNHDASLNSNQDRMDAISPIIELVRNQKDDVWYLKDTGKYHIKGLDFFVYSCLDKNIIEEKYFDTPNPKILLYHGVIGGVQSYLGYEFSEDHQDKRIDFSRFDCGMLGDIHIIGEPKRGHCYPSSLVCQNFGEHPTKHGYLIWEIENGKSIPKPKYQTIHNDWGYYTIYVNDDYSIHYKDFDSTSEIPMYASVRVIYDNACEIIKVKDILSNKFVETQTIDYLSKKTVSNLDEKEISIKNEIIDLHDLNAQEQLLKEYLSDEKPEVIEQVVKLNKEINIECAESIEKKRDKNYYQLLDIGFSNLFSYGEDNFVDFTKIKGVISNFSPNATGKSSFLNAIPFSIFGNFPYMKTNASVMNNASDSLHTKINLKLNNSKYTIERTGKRNKKSVSLSLSLTETLPDGTIVNHSEDVRDTQKKINDLFGDLDAYSKSSYMSQKGSPMFLDLTPMNRNEWFSKNLGIEFFDILNKRAKENSDDLRVELKKLKTRDFMREEMDILEIKNQNIAFRKQTLKDIKELESQLQILNSKKEELLSSKRQIVPITNPHDKIVELEQHILLLESKYAREFSKESLELKIKDELEEITNKIIEITDEIESKKKSLESETISLPIDQKIEDVKDLLADEKEKYLKNKEQQATKKPSDYTDRAKTTELSEQYAKELSKQESISVDIDQIESQISRLEKNTAILSEDERFTNEKLCKSCILLEKIWEENNSIQGLRDSLIVKSSELEQVSAVISQLREKVVMYTDYEEILDEYNSILKNREELISKRDILLEKRDLELLNIIDKKKNIINNLEKDLEHLEASVGLVKTNVKSSFLLNKKEAEQKISEQRNLLNQLKEQHKKYESYLSDVAFNEQLEKSIDEVVEFISSVQMDHKSKNIDLNNFDYEIKKCDERIEHLLSEKIWYEESALKYSIYDKYLNATSKNGLPYFIIKKVLKDLEQSVNDILSTVVDFRVLLTAESGNVECEMTSDEKGVWQSDLLSGMETFMVNLAFRLGISQIANVSQPNFLVVDEGFSALDVEHTQELPKLFNLLKSKLDFILIVSHNPTVRDFVDHELVISRKDGKSYISS